MTRKRHQNSISLFPFLAVLVCAMGALILLLLVMTRKIRHEQFGDPIPQLEALAPTVVPPDRSSEIAALESERQVVTRTLQQLQQQVDELQLAVTRHEAAVAVLRQQMTELEGTLQSAESTPDESDIASLQKRIAQLRSQHNVLRRKLDEQEKQLLAKQQLLTNAKANAVEAQQKLIAMNSTILALRKQIELAEQTKPSDGVETVVDFTNTTGTTRTPIMVEVTKDGYRIVPAGVVIQPKELDGFPISDTPLMAAILAVHRERSKRSVTSNPYVLLLVRPSGSEAFYTAQSILANEKMHFGYELLDDEQKIAAGESDSAEVNAAEVAMRETFLRRDKIHANLRVLAQALGQGGGTPGANGNSRAPDPTTRGLSFRADGTVGSESKITSRGMSSRNYAGGVAPPPGFYENRKSVNEFTPGTHGTSEPDSVGDQVANQFADHYARSATPDGAGHGEVSAPTPTPSVPFPQQIPGGDSPVMPQAQFARQGKDTSTEIPGTQSTGRPPALGSSERAESVLFNNNATAPVVANGRPAEAPWSSSADSGKAAGNGEPSLTAEEQFASMMAGKSSPDSQTAQSRHLQTPSSSETSGSSSASGEPQTGAPASPLIDLTRVDKDLLQRLPSTKKGPKAYATPVGVTVFLDGNHMTVGQHPAVVVTPDTLNTALTDLLRNIDTEVTDAKKSPHEAMMPVVKFIVSPGGERWRIPLAGSLKDLGIPSASVYELSPHIEVTAAPGRARY